MLLLLLACLSWGESTFTFGSSIGQFKNHRFFGKIHNKIKKFSSEKNDLQEKLTEGKRLTFSECSNHWITFFSAKQRMPCNSLNFENRQQKIIRVFVGYYKD